MTCKGPINSPPVIVTELLQLINLGIPLAHITWPRVSMISDKWISICHSGNSKNLTSGHNTVVTVLNLHHSLPQTWEASATCAKMNPVKPVIALRAGQLFQIFNLETRKCYQKYKMSAPVDFWTWIDLSVIAIVTESAVHLWDTNYDVPKRLFYRDARLINAQIVNCVVDPSYRWIAVSGLFLEDNKVAGVAQVYSVDQNLSQTFEEAHWVKLISGKLQGNAKPTTILVVASRCWGKSGKLHVVELGPHVPGNFALSVRTESLEFNDPWDRYDFPISIQVSLAMGLVYVVTKFGYIYICDFETAVPLCCCTICPDIVFTTALNQETQGIVAISRNGQVLSVDLKKEHLIKYVEEVVKKPHIAERLSKLSTN